MRHGLISAALVAIGALWLSACGGGGDDDEGGRKTAIPVECAADPKRCE